MPAGRETVGDWASVVGTTTAEAFAAEQGIPFLVQERSAPRPDDSQELQFATLDAGSEDVSTEALLGSASLASLLALPICKRDGSGLSGMVNVGRAENCDLVLLAASVSKFHAFFTRDAVSGLPQLVDGASTNGTSVNGSVLEPHEPRDLVPRDLIAFGADSIWRFHSPETFHELVCLAS